MDEHTQKMLRELEEIYALVEEGKMFITRMDKSTTLYGPDEITMTIQVKQGVTNLGKTLTPNPAVSSSHVHTVTVSNNTQGIYSSKEIKSQMSEYLSTPLVPETTYITGITA